MAHSSHIGFDLDGVILDHSTEAARLAHEYGFELEQFQTNSNIIGRYIPDEILTDLKEKLYSRTAATAFDGAFEALREIHTTYPTLKIISARRGSNKEKAREQLASLDFTAITGIPLAEVVFYESTGDKIAALQAARIDCYTDDQLQVASSIRAPGHGMLFDPYGLIVKGEIRPLSHSTRVMTSWEHVAQHFLDLPVN